MITPNGRYLGGKKDWFDSRDLKLHLQSHMGIGAPLPPFMDVLVGTNIPVIDQGDLGRCTAATGRTFRRWLAQKFPKLSAVDVELSMDDLYWQERDLVWNSSVDEDSGAQIRDIFICLSKYGICPLVDYSDDPRLFRLAPTAKAIGAALNYKITAYHRVTDLNSVKGCLASGYPVAMGFPVYDSFESIGGDGLMPMPGKSEDLLGGHAVFCHGYDDSKLSLIIQNSWGPDWGAKGHFYMPYAFAQKFGADIDYWTGHLGPKW